MKTEKSWISFITSSIYNKMEHFRLPGLQVAALSCSYSLSTTRVIKAFKQIKFWKIANLYHLKILKNMIRDGIVCVCSNTIHLTY